MACHCPLLWLLLSLAIWPSVFWERNNIRLLEFRDIDIPRCHFCRQFKGIFKCHFLNWGRILSFCIYYISAGYRISLLDSVIRFFYPDIDYWVHWSYLSLLGNRYVSLLNVIDFLYSISTFVHNSESLENEHMLFVYMTLLSTGPSWLFTLFAIWTALLPDFLVAIWETYSAGGGVLVNKVRFSVIILKKKRFQLNSKRVQREI